MPGIARQGDTVSTGHDCDSTTIIKDHSSDVFANGIPVARKGDGLEIHTIKVGDSCVPHSAQINVGSGNVFVNGIPVARKGDSADAGSITGSSGNVFAN